MGDELDYMADDFITNFISDNHTDVRPGLLKNRREQREHELMKKKAEAAAEKRNKKSLEVCQTEALEEGLKHPINSSNKGFCMLQKMGFQDGMGLGKHSRGITEPIAINIKKNKHGLGHRTQTLKVPQKRKLDDKLSSSLKEKDYLALHSRKDRERKIIGDLRKSQKICKELDSKNNKNEPNEMWFWPIDSENIEKKCDDDNEAEKEEIEEDREFLDDETKLEILTKYLRKTYYYCIWCSIQFEDEIDLKECPGMTRDDH